MSEVNRCRVCSMEWDDCGCPESDARCWPAPALIPSSSSEELEQVMKTLPDYFKALDLPWWIAVDYISAFVDSDEEPMGPPDRHARNLFRIARALQVEYRRLTARGVECLKKISTPSGSWTCPRPHGHAGDCGLKIYPDDMGPNDGVEQAVGK